MKNGRRPHRRATLAMLGACIATLALAGVAQAQTLTLGPRLVKAVEGAIPCGIEGGCSVAALALPEVTAVSPVAGRVIQWSVAEPTEVKGYELLVAHPNDNGTYTATASSGPVTPKKEEVATFSTNLPIAAGDLVELIVPNASTVGVFEGSGAYVSWEPPLKLGETRTAREEGKSPFAVGFNATVEYSSLAPVLPAPIVISPAPKTPPPEAHCVVPNLSGKKLQAAKAKLRGADCKIGLLATKTGTKAATGRIVKQAPKPGSTLPAGSVVSLKLG